MPSERTDSFAYDQLGNRKGVNVIASLGSITFTRDNNGLNQYQGWTQSAINYDDDYGAPWGAPGAANGVLMQDGWMTASFNALNQPLSIWSWRTNPSGSSLNFYHDPLGRCVKRTNDGGVSTYLYYDGWNLIQEGPAASVADRIYAHGNRVDEVVASQYGGAWAYHHYDARGHCTMLTNASGGLLEQYDYDAFGKPYFYNATGVSQTSSGWGNRFLFTGREWLKDIAVYDFRNRHYLPELARFIQPDPKQFEAGDYNLYRYCHNDPVNKSDPFGLDVILRIDGVYFGNDVTMSEFAGGRERGHMPSAYNERIQVNPDRSEAALPARLPSAVRDSGIEIANPNNGRETSAKITDVGPHNERDRYWEKGARPMAEKQYAEGTTAQNGKVPDNRAGLDGTPKVMNDLGVKGGENTRQTRVIWSFKNEPFAGHKRFYGKDH